jgi:hypothetical protein
MKPWPYNNNRNVATHSDCLEAHAFREKRTYEIIRFYSGVDHSRTVIKSGLTLKEAEIAKQEGGE